MRLRVFMFSMCQRPIFFFLIFEIVISPVLVFMYFCI